MSDTIQGAIVFVVFMAIVIAASRVLARFTAAKYSRALMPLAPLINGTFATDSLSHGWLWGTYGNREVHVASIPGVNSMSGSGNEGGSAHRYNAFEVEVQNVAGERDWSLKFGLHSVSQILSRDESWKFLADEDLLQRLESSNIIGELETFAGAGVRGFPTVIYNARQKTLTHRDNISPNLAPSVSHFEKQLALALRLAEISEQVNSPADMSA